MNNIVTFPALNLRLNINPVVFSIFGINIYWYGIIIVSSIITAMIVLKILDDKYNINFNQIIDLLVFLIPISIISARIYYVLFNLDYYLSDPLQIMDFRSGGLAIYGGIIGGFITCLIYCRIKQIDLLDILDYLAPALVLAQAIGRWGNFVNIEAYGTTTNLPWRMGIYEINGFIEVHPTFLYESLACLIIFIVLLLIKRKFKGQIVGTYFLLYSFERAFVENLRTDSLMLGNIRVSQFLSVLIFIFCLVFLLKNVVKQK